MTGPQSGSGRWLSFHLFLEDSFDSFLAESLLPWLETAIEAGRIRRFYFIRYSEGGHHLRLRFIAGPGGNTPLLAASLDDCVSSHRPGSGFRLTEQPYDRASLYFGETLASVYAELLNEATSWLCLRLLKTPEAGHRLTRWLLLAALLDQLLRDAATDLEDYGTSLAGSLRFARQAVGSVGEGMGEPDPEKIGQLGTAVQRLGPRLSRALAGDSSTRRITRLLRRANRGAERERFAATHGLHLLCNKTGFSLRDELLIFDTLGWVQAQRGGRDLSTLAPAGSTATTLTRGSDAKLAELPRLL